MNSVRTKTFELAVYAKGNINSPKLALVLPGKLDTKDYPHMKSHVDYLSEKGYFSLSFDPPGTWGSPGDISLYTMTNYLTAINELIEYFGNKQTFVVGHSRGGSMAMLAGTRNPNVTEFAAIMSYFNPSMVDLDYDKKWMDTGFKLSKRDVPYSNKSKEFKLPYSFHEDEIKYDVIEDLKKSQKPKLFIYGRNDTTVRPEIVKTAYEASSQPKQLCAIDSDHNYRLHTELIDKVNAFIGEFLDKYGQKS